MIKKLVVGSFYELKIMNNYIKATRIGKEADGKAKV